LNKMEPGRGYMIKMKNPCDLTYPLLNRKRLARKHIQKNNIPEWNIDTSEFEYFGTITCTVIENNLPIVQPGDIIAAFINNECRGYASAQQTPSGYIFFLQVWSNKKQDFELRYRKLDNSILVIKRRIQFIPNMEIGSINTPEQFLIQYDDPPGWQVDSAKYEKFGTITAQIMINDVQTNDILGVFSENECRGYVLPTETPNGLIFFLQIWGDESQQMDMKYFSSKEGQIIDLEYTVNYIPMMSEGSINNPSKIKLKDSNDYSFDVNKDETVNLIDLLLILKRLTGFE